MPKKPASKPSVPGKATSNIRHGGWDYSGGKKPTAADLGGRANGRAGAQGKGGTTGETYWGRPGLNNAKYAPKSGVGNGSKRGRPPGVKNGQGRGKR